MGSTRNRDNPWQLAKQQWQDPMQVDLGQSACGAPTADNSKEQTCLRTALPLEDAVSLTGSAQCGSVVHIDRNQHSAIRRA